MINSMEFGILCISHFGFLGLGILIGKYLLNNANQNNSEEVKE